MKESLSLDRLPEARIGCVLEVDAEEPAGERLLALGLLPGTTVALVGVAPLGDPMAIRAGRLVLAIRRRDAACVSISLEPEASLP